ncbi:efflux transporter outer membrane subunit [Paraburkholderia haematera]|uniref:Toluene efflux pump outer membrane protein TtgI n=1 Tax=Paraburkholderia haematera TaxID=2793077 RepID=A0ABM8SG42_9BURK|nr:efflux transporter outer membrane subunit [Paraburkholderia haematera]CAE6807377.1 Toluene efflux pump outer membrane protein TtgI [Paraburkholderia haematera]
MARLRKLAAAPPSRPPYPRRRIAGLGAIVATWAGLLTGCTVGPDYVPPKPVMPAAFTEQTGSAANAASTAKEAQTSHDAWWEGFDDATLNALMTEALHAAPDLAIAQARVREARALRGIAGAEQYPTASAGALYDRTHGSANVPVGVPPGGLGPGANGNLWQAGFDASWEIDVFGGKRRGVESADASYQAAVADMGDVELTLLAEVARNYIELRGVQRQLAVARNNLSIQQDSLSLTRSQFDAGLASRLDVLRAQAQVSDTEAAIPTFQADERASIYRIGALIGHPPEELLAQLDTPQAIPSAVADVPVGLPSDLLRRRPDIRAADRRIAAANARIGVAQADLYPHFSLTGVAGLESLNASTFLTAPSRYFSIGPNISWLIFDAGKVRFAMRAEEARTDQAAAVYQRTVLGALRDVETALVSYAQSHVRRDRLAAEVAADREAVTIATRLYRQGLNDFLSVLDAERSLYAADDKLAQSDRDMALALVALYKALGGGWQEATDAAHVAAGQP